jgi:ectoine hydroxylase-related dioxygenase (phytanoyl-CoA dioxygenase family)
VIDRASEVFRAIIAEERESAAGKGDHFAAAGANDRIWNSLQKQCLKDPQGFALYFGNPALAAAAEAWLGPNSQMTAQVNQVRPGGKAQTAHRDYHLGFMSADEAMRYPAHAHEVTATLTLQGAVAHVDMPVESGPTKLLPFSQLYGPGYVAFHDAGFRDWFEEAHVQVPLDKGDAVFFNPALFHAGGENRSPDVERMVNLLQPCCPNWSGSSRPARLGPQSWTRPSPPAPRAIPFRPTWTPIRRWAGWPRPAWPT